MELLDPRDIARLGEDEFRRYLRALYAEGDRLRAEHEEWLAQRALAKPPVISAHDNSGDAPLPAPAAGSESSNEEWVFSDAQMDVLAQAFSDLSRAWQQDIERAQRRIFDAMVRMGLPGELAEREVHDLRGRVIRAEQQIERRLKEALGDDQHRRSSVWLLEA